jgi:uncharacterized protein YerC
VLSTASEVKSTLVFVVMGARSSTEGSGVESEEVRRVVDAIDALGEMSDTLARARALTTLLDDWPDHHSRIRQLRQDAFRMLSDEGMTYKEIGAELGISAARVGQIVTGVTNPRTQKNPPPKQPRRKRGTPPAE